MTGQTVVLSHDECHALALRLVARHVQHDPEMVADWEHDQLTGIDSRHLLERAS